jgi:hypothetical protein
MELYEDLEGIRKIFPLRGSDWMSHAKSERTERVDSQHIFTLFGLLIISLTKM